VFKRNTFTAVTLVLVSIVLALVLPSCSSKGSTEGPSGDSIISGELKGLRKHSSGYSYQIDFLVESSKDVGTLPNPTKDKVGKVITAETNENLRELEVGEDFTANVKLVYDAAKTGTIFYVYNVKESD
jgi:hypothetical protein